MKLIFSYCQCKSGRYFICNIPPEYMYKDEKLGIWTFESKYSKEVDSAYKQGKAAEDFYWIRISPDKLPNFRIEGNKPFHWANLIDLSNVPKPKWEDKSPILITLDITSKTSYCIYD